jgi:ferric-dicitrate binding protein FerR (iron transport regulator)
MNIRDHLPLVEAPEEIWAAIEAARERPQRGIRRASFARMAIAATITIGLLAGVAYWVVAHRSRQWIETGPASRATLRIGDLGTVDVAPNSRLRVVPSATQVHRLELAYGGLYAKISAPPRLFFVETPAGTAVDLGCEYALNVDKNGYGVLGVTKGWVSFQWNKIESLVPAGASCRIFRGGGPGVPRFDDATAALKQALEELGTERAQGDTLQAILTAARVRDTLTLWHLLARVEPADRARVFDRIAALTPVPAGVSREKALLLDPETLMRWKEELAWTW